MKFTFTVNNDLVDKEYQKLLAKTVETTTVKGFRKGKAPKDMVEQKLDKNKLRQEAIERVLPDAYIAEIKKQNLKPISYPQIKLKNVEPNSDLVFEAEIAQKPEVKLNNYQTDIKDSAAKSKIWTPEKGNPDQKGASNSQKSEEDKLKIIFDVLLSTCQVEVPSMLIDQEVNRMLSKLLDQINKLGLDIDEYLSSIGKNKDNIRTEYSQTANETLKLEFILQAVVEDLKIQVGDNEIDALIATVPDPKAKANFANPMERANLKAILGRRKAIEHLEKLLA